MKVSSLFIAAFPAVLALPSAQKADCCQNIDWLLQANRGQSNAGAFCSKFLSISTSTIINSITTTVTGAKVTVTNVVTAQTVATISSTSTITALASVLTTTYATSTCTPATPYTPPAAMTTAATNSNQHQKRDSRYPNQWCWSWNWPYPTYQYNPAQISDACSCIVTTPTTCITKTATVTKPGPTSTVSTTKTITKSTSAPVQSTTVTSTTTSTVTSTELRPYAPTGTYVSPNGALFNDFNGIDFQRGDLDGGDFCNCDADSSGGDCIVRGVNYGKCLGFNSCQDVCAGINNQTQALTCVAVTYNGPDSSGACYFKQSLEGCGYYNDGRRSGQIELNGYKF